MMVNYNRKRIALGMNEAPVMTLLPSLNTVKSILLENLSFD